MLSQKHNLLLTENQLLIVICFIYNLKLGISEVLKAVLIQIQVLQDVTLCRLVTDVSEGYVGFWL